MHTSMQYLIKMAGRNSYTLLLLVICAALCIETSESITEQENEYINLAGEEHEAGREKREINLDENILESDLAIFDEAADVEKRDTMLKIDAVMESLVADEEHGSDIEKRQVLIGPIDPIDPIRVPTILRPPPATINKPRRVLFDYTTKADLDPGYSLSDKGVLYADGSSLDETASEWSVITPAGYEYSGSRDVLKTVFSNSRRSSKTGVLVNGVDPGGDGPTTLFFDASIHRFERSVFPPDTRIKVGLPHIYPWAAMGYVESGCSGTFIGPRHILTAGHCVYNYRTQRWYSNLNFRRAKNCDPHKGTLYRWRYAITVKGWTKYGYASYDYAMIVVDRSSPYIMNYGYLNYMPKWIININGYPGDKPDTCMWHSHCRIQHVFSKQLGYKCDTYHGMSGSAVYAYWRTLNRRIIYCIHAYGKSSSKNYNKCTRITKLRFYQFGDWISKY